MVDIFSDTHNNSGPLTPYHNRIPLTVEQDAGYARLVGVAPPASCPYTPPINILRLPDVIKRVGLKRASIYLHIGKGTFPKPISLGPRAVGWIESEIDTWLAVRIQIRRGNRHDGV